MRVSDEILQTIRSRVSIVELVGQHVALKRTGKNWKGLCPFHSEKTPSFTVSDERGSYHCFGCGAGGSAFRFLMELEGKTFLEAVRALAERAGVRLTLGPEESRDRRAREERELLRELLELAARYYRHQLVEGRAGERARAYLERRGIPADAAEAFSLGCAPAGWDHLARYLGGKGVDLELAARAGLVAPRSSGGYYDRLRDRLVFPISDVSGRVLSFGGRLLDPGEPKYLNGPETPVFHKGELLYGMHQATEALRRERRALLVEGYLDVISLHARGYPTALATLGTAMTAEHIQVLRRRADEVVTLYDGDEAGRKAAFRSLDLFLAQGFPCRGILLPPEHDPDSFVRQGGNLTPLVDAARPLFEVYVEDVTTRWDLGTVEGKLAAADALAPKLALISDSLARDLYAKQASEVLGVDETQLRARIRPPPGPRGRGAEPPMAEPARDPTEKALLEILVHEPERRAAFRAAGVEAMMRPGPLREAARFVADRAEKAGDLPLDDAPEATRQALTEILVGDGKPLSPYPMLEAKLRLGALDAQACRVVDELRQAEARGDQGRIDELMQEQTEVMRALVDCRRAAFGKAP